MSLQLFANYERTTDSTTVYRAIGVPSTYTVKLRFQDTHYPGSFLSDTNIYSAQYNVDNSPANSIFTPSLTASVTFALSGLPVETHFINVTAFNMIDFSVEGIYQFKYVFGQQIQSIKHIAFPVGYIDMTNPPYTYVTRGSRTFYDYTRGLLANENGNKFIGEGHTETIFLSTTPFFGTAHWTVGPYKLSTPYSTATIKISSNSNVAKVYPISVLVTDDVVTEDTPLITHDDQSGEPEFYPFYSSSLTVNGNEISLLSSDPVSNYEPSLREYNTLQKSLSVLRYPEISNPKEVYNLAYPWSADQTISLPLDSTNQIFKARITPLSIQNNIFNQKFIGSKWRLKGTTNLISQLPEWTTTTELLSSSLNVFRFPLSYNDTANIVGAPLKASITNTTLITLEVSAYNYVGIEGDWQSRYQINALSSTLLIDSLPISRLFTKSYYYQINDEVKITNVWNTTLNGATPLQTTIFSNKLIPPVTFKNTGEQQSLFFGSQDIGFVDLSAVTVFRDSRGNMYDIIYEFPDVIQIVDTYDDVVPKHYDSGFTPLHLTYKSAPRLAPNEWVTDDNVNSIIDKLDTTITELDGYTNVYKQTNVLAGIIEQTIAPYILPATDTLIDAQYGNILRFTGIPLQVINIPEYIVLENAPDPLYIDIHTPLSYATLTVIGYRWVTPETDLLGFENFVPPVTGVPYRGATVMPVSKNIVVGYANGIVLFDSDYPISIRGVEDSVDKLFTFTNIQSIQTTSNDYIIIIDSAVSRVSVYSIVNNAFELFSTWGSYGSAQSRQGFNKPQDLHIDQDDLLWIADTGNSCIKKFTISGKNLLTITNDVFVDNPPISVCVDSQRNIHALTKTQVHVFDQYGTYQFSYNFKKYFVTPKKINTSYNRETIYITYNNGVAKYFRTGSFYQFIFDDYMLPDGTTLTGYNTISQDASRNLYITIDNVIFVVSDLMKLEKYKNSITENLIWDVDQIYIHKDEYIQPWVYLKSFHRLWDNIEALRNSLFYQTKGCKKYNPPVYTKEEITIGQNEIVTNAVVNRIAQQLWSNIETIIQYFDPNCVYVEPVVFTTTPTPTFTSSPTPTLPITVTPTRTITPTPTNTSTSSPTPTITPTPTFTAPNRTPTMSPTHTPSLIPYNAMLDFGTIDEEFIDTTEYVGVSSSGGLRSVAGEYLVDIPFKPYDMCDDIVTIPLSGSQASFIMRSLTGCDVIIDIPHDEIFTFDDLEGYSTIGNDDIILDTIEESCFTGVSILTGIYTPTPTVAPIPTDTPTETITG